ncbi:pseudouridine synthase [Tardiphaga alba]|uniref:Pseudouridine synthase n=1 Tax=Tardiphaga alba TaxID=340268 RepID=A0ABX8AC42_9BRAD|nr:pseudouridine synthase [Tardiphaga alba]QUS41277.1 pseudouridine synthase [Tardiphaga alba]
MPRDNDKNNGPSRGRPPGGRGPAKGPSKGGRSGAARGPEKKFAKRDGSYTPRPPRDGDGEKRPYAGKRDGGDRAPRRDYGDAPRPRFNRDERPARSDGDRPSRGPRKDFGDRPPRRDRDDARPAGRFSDKKFGDRKPRDGDRPFSARPSRDGDRPRGDRPFGDRKPRDGGGEKRPYAPRGDRPQGDRPYGARPSRDGDRPRGDRPFGEKKFSRGAPDRGGPRKSFGGRGDRDFERGPDRSDEKPWQSRERSDDRGSRPARAPRDGERKFDRPKFDKPKFDKPRFERSRDDRPERGDGERPRFERSREDRPQFERSREPRGRADWHEQPRRGRDSDRDERPRRDNEDDSQIFRQRPAFGGRGEYRPRDPDAKKAPRKPAEKKGAERIAKVVARAGLCSRRDAEEWVTQGRVSVNGRKINSPALDVTANDVITVDGKPLPERERTRLFMYHKPRGLMTTHADPEGRPTVFDHLPEDLPRLISIGRLDFNTEGLLLLTNDGGLARTLELPDTGWLRRYRVRAHGNVTQAQLDELKNGVEVDGVKYGAIDATLERDQGANVWLVFAIREGKNREVRNVCAHLGLEVNRLIRISYGPFQLGELEEGEVDEVKTRVLREQLGEKIAEAAGADFGRQLPSKGDTSLDPVIVKKPVMKRSTVEDRKGRRVVVQRSGSEETRARKEADAMFGGPKKPPKRGYKGKRDLKPRDE